MFNDTADYAEPGVQLTTKVEYGWDHSLGEIVTALAEAGLRIELLREHPFLNCKVDFLVEAGDGTWRLPPDAPGELPLMISILATKPA